MNSLEGVQEGENPHHLRTAYFFILNLRTACGLIMALCNSYR